MSHSTRSFRAEITANANLQGPYFLLSLRPLDVAPAPLPGQFYMVGSGGTSFEPLLKRPFCLLRERDGSIDILYRVCGKGTLLLSGIRPGTRLDVVGPLGNSYQSPPAGNRAIIVAGGSAIASLYPFIAGQADNAIVVFGARSSGDLVLLDEVKGLTKNILVCTDDGSAGMRGTVLDAMRTLDINPGDVLYVCGPKGMLRAVSAFARERGLRGYASLEEYMACGIGACMGCVVKTHAGYMRVCKEGPIFDLGELVI